MNQVEVGCWIVHEHVAVAHGDTKHEARVGSSVVRKVRGNEAGNAARDVCGEVVEEAAVPFNSGPLSSKLSNQHCISRETIRAASRP